VSANEANPGLDELVRQLTNAGFRFDLRPVASMQNGASRQIYYGVSVLIDGMAPADLEQLLMIVNGSAYDGKIDNRGRLVLQAPLP
jgi:hypothetical protein